MSIKSALGLVLAWVLVSESQAIGPDDIDRINNQGQLQKQSHRQQLRISQSQALTDWVRRLGAQKNRSTQPSTDTSPEPPGTELGPPTRRESIHTQTSTAAGPILPTAKHTPAPSATKARTAKPNTQNYRVASVEFGKRTTHHYGIHYDQWMTAELRHTVTSQDKAPVRLYLSESIRGKYKTLPAGTVLVGYHSFDISTERLFIRINRAHLVNGEQIGLKASVYDHAKKYGLTGTVINRQQQRFEHGGRVFGKSLAANVVDQALNQTDPLLERSIDSGVDAYQSGQITSPTPQSYLQVEAQKVYIHIESNI